MAFGVEYIIGLIDRFTPAAESVAKSAIKADESLAALGGKAESIEGQMAGLAESMKAVAGATGGIANTSKQAAEALGNVGKAAQASGNNIDAFLAKAKANYDTKFSNNPRFFKPDGSPINPGTPEKGESGVGGLGFMGGLWALSGLHNDVLKTWQEFDNQMRLMRGVMAGKLTDQDVVNLKASAIEASKGTIFGPEAIAEVYKAQASRGVPITLRTEDGRMLGEVVARQMLGIATATGEKPEEAFQTHLQIARGFGMKDENFAKEFPHISDTIALLAQRSGITMAQARTQMANIAGTARVAGWTEDETAAAIGVLQRHGVGQFAGVGLRRVVEQSTKAWSKQQKEGWERLHISQNMLKDPKTGGVITPLALSKLLEEHTKGMSQFDIEKSLSQIFGSKAMAVGAQLIGSSKELEEMTRAMETVQGLAEKFGTEGSKGGAAGLMKFAAGWERLKTSIGESGFGDHIGALAGKVGDLMDSLSKNTVGAEGVGWLAAALNGLSSIALPLMALPAIGNLLGFMSRITGLSAAFRSLGAALGVVQGEGMVAGFLRLSTGIGAMVANAVGLSSVASSMTLLAGSARLLLGLTGIGAALLIGYEVVEHWKQIADAITRTASALKELAKGNTQPMKDLANDTAKALGIDKPKDPMLQQPHGKFGNWHPQQSPADAAHAAAAQRVQADVNVKMDPIQINPATANVNVHVDVDAKGVGTGTGSGSMPLSATAPRGTTAASPSNPQVAR